MEIRHKKRTVVALDHVKAYTDEPMDADLVAAFAEDFQKYLLKERGEVMLDLLNCGTSIRYYRNKDRS